MRLFSARLRRLYITYIRRTTTLRRCVWCGRISDPWYRRLSASIKMLLGRRLCLVDAVCPDCQNREGILGDIVLSIRQEAQEFKNGFAPRGDVAQSVSQPQSPGNYHVGSKW